MQIFYMYHEGPKSGSIPTKLSTQNWQTAGEALPLIDVGFGKGALYNEIVGPRYAFSFVSRPLLTIHVLIKSDQPLLKKWSL